MENIKPIPSDTTIERAVIAGCINNRDILIQCTDALTPDAFYNESNRLLFNTMINMFARGKGVDLITLSNELKKTGGIEQIGGIYELTKLSGILSNSYNIDTYIHILLQLYAKRKIIELSMQLTSDAFSDSSDGIELIDKFNSDSINLNAIINDNKQKSILDICQNVMNKIEKIRINDSTVGIKSGFKIDEFTSGFCEQDLNILAARPGVGKTALACSMIINICKTGVPVAFFSLEMSASQIIMRMLSSMSEVNHNAIRNPGSLSIEDLIKVQNINDKLKLFPLYIDDTAGITIQKLRSKAIKFKNEFDIKILFVDYIQLIRPGNIGKDRSRENEVSYISQNIKAIAKELNISIIALSQLSRLIEHRSGKDKKPRLSDLRESGSIEQDADIVMFLYSENDDTENYENITELIISKNRNGSLGCRPLIFKKNYVKFIDSDINEINTINWLQNKASEEPF